MVSNSFSPSRSATVLQPGRQQQPQQSQSQQQQQQKQQHLKPPPLPRSGWDRSHTEASGVHVHPKTTMPSRRLSLPDLKELRQEWSRREALQINTLPAGKLQIDLLNVRSDVTVKRPFIRLRMGPQRYFSSRSKQSNGNWNEGFLFTISFHNQLFDTIELDLFDKRKGWRSKTRHIGKAKLRISTLNERPEVFLTFIPMYEYHTRRYLPAHIQLPHTFLKTHMPRFRTQEQAPYQEQYPSHRKNSMTPLIGSIQVRVRYHYQTPPDAFSHEMLSPIYKDSSDTHSFVSSYMDRSTLASSQSGKSKNSMVTLNSVTTANTTVSSNGNNTDFSREDSDDDDDLTDDNGQLSENEERPRQNNTDDFHDAVEPKLVFIDDLGQVPPPSNTAPPKANPTVDSQSIVDRVFVEQLQNKLARRTESTRRMKTEDTNDSAAGFGFSRSDMENRSRSVRRKNSESSIQSNNFGDKNFAFRWINESFDEVALAHPSLDRMIGFVVSPQTRILVRAVVKIFTGFGQGFRITGLQLLSCLSFLQNFYVDIPRSPPAEKIKDLRFLDKANYFLGHAIIAYGWRGLSYLGDYAKYLKDVMKTRSNKEAIVRYLKIPPEDLLGYEYGLRKGAVFQPSYFVAIDRGYEAIVLGIRGTWSLYDCITDLVCEYRPWKGGLVHAGMLASAQWFFTRIIPQIFHYVHEQCKSETRPISSFIITGHSLGAGTAALLTMMVLDHLPELRRLADNPNFQVHCYSYAPVASVSMNLSEKYAEHIDSFVCHDDLVARLSYGTASCAKELIMDAMIAVDGMGGSSKLNSDKKARKACFDIIEARRQEIFNSSEPRYPLLYVPGQVYQFRRRPQDTPSPSPSSTTTNNNNKPRFSTSSFDNRPRPKSEHLSTDTSIPISHSEPALRKRSGSTTSSSSSSTLSSSETPSFTLHRSSPMISEELLISKTCLEDHMLVTYLNAFQAVRQDCMRELRQKKKNRSSLSSTAPSTTPSSSVPSILIEDPEGKVEPAPSTPSSTPITAQS
ncbi:hypothetical protein BDA99DRAFT_562656 [Phascolomyces articulosus]|uniref:sn-1-specific diacylglycerol lipase n=1 Tax=Phascolomyces articulosus TaxID=60185 RepID=A0AAD5PB22_9FUNG|nr:hypothetical protein BDA99DRAFT_562656 [Phascolomyces articulosus]